MKISKSPGSVKMEHVKEEIESSAADDAYAVLTV